MLSLAQVVVWIGFASNAIVWSLVLIQYVRVARVLPQCSLRIGLRIVVTAILADTWVLVLGVCWCVRVSYLFLADTCDYASDNH